MADKNTPVVAFVGLGSMGLGMAKNLLKHGHQVIGVDPSIPAKVAFAQAGVQSHRRLISPPNKPTPSSWLW